jgi:hypothetical protein
MAEVATVRTTIAAEARSKGDKPRLEWVTIFLKNPKKSNPDFAFPQSYGPFSESSEKPSVR